MKKWMVLALIVISGAAFTGVLTNGEYEPVPIPPSVQRTGGDVQKGYDYLVTGDYVKGGIPFNMFVMGMGKSKTNYLERTGKNADISHEYTAVTSTNGEVLVAPNCMQCHAQVFDNKLVLGLGNTFIDFSNNEKLNLKSLRTLENMLKLTAPHKYKAA